MATHNSIISQGLPYLVAASAECPSDILGYTYAQGFRAGKGAYRHTVEITLYCHPDQQGKKIGTKLLTRLLDALKNPERCPSGMTGDHVPRARVRQVLAVMAVDETGPRTGLALKQFYERFGFKLVGNPKVS